AVVVKDPRAGAVKVDRIFQLQALEPEGTARVRARIAAHRDAEGNIPPDLETQELEWALDALSGTGEVVFDVALGQPRRVTSTVRTVFVNRPAPTGAHELPDYPRVMSDVETTATLELLSS